MKVGMVLEGGALRTIFSTGVLDAMLEKDLMTDYVVGVSAGIAYGVRTRFCIEKTSFLIRLDVSRETLLLG